MRSVRLVAGLGLLAALAGGPVIAADSEYRRIPTEPGYPARLWEVDASNVNGPVKRIRLLSASVFSDAAVAVETTEIYDCAWGLRRWGEGQRVELNASGAVVGTTNRQPSWADQGKKGELFEHFCAEGYSNPGPVWVGRASALRQIGADMAAHPLKSNLFPPVESREGPLPPIGVTKIWTLENDPENRRAMVLAWSNAVAPGGDNWPTAYLVTFTDDGGEGRLTRITSRAATIGCVRRTVGIGTVRNWVVGRGEESTYYAGLEWQVPRMGPIDKAITQVCAKQERPKSEFTSLDEALASFRATWAP